MGRERRETEGEGRGEEARGRAGRGVGGPRTQHTHIFFMALPMLTALPQTP